MTSQKSTSLYLSSVSGVLFSQDRSKVLLIKRRDNPIWVLPGGGVDPKEEPEKAVIREMEEETGLKTVIKRKVAEYTPINQLTNFTHFYELALVSGKVSTGEETLDIRFFPINNLPKNLFFLHKIWIDDALANHPFILRQLLVQTTYLKGLKYLLFHPIRTFRYLLAKLGIPYNT